MEKDRPGSSSRDKAARQSKNNGGLEKGHGKGGLEKGHGKGGLEKGHDNGGLEKGQPIRGGAYRTPSLDMKEEEFSQAFDEIVKKSCTGF